MRRVLDALPGSFRGKDIVELGSGTGVQLQMLAEIGKTVIGLELSGSPYLLRKVCDIREYDGEHLPFATNSVDVVFSSNVIEHIREQEKIHKEIRRVLKVGGKAIHVVPSRVWRMLTSAIHYPAVPIQKLTKRVGNASAGDGQHARGGSRWMKKLKRLIPEQHGEIGSWLGEYRDFGLNSWRGRFEEMGFEIEYVKPLGLLYSGYALFGDKVGFVARTRLAKVCGSSAIMFVMRAA